MDEIIEQTGHNAAGDIVITSDSYVVYEYCTSTNEDGQCISRMQVVPRESLQVQNTNRIESNSNTAVFVIVVMLLVWLVKGIFRLILPTKWKRN